MKIKVRLLKEENKMAEREIRNKIAKIIMNIEKPFSISGLFSFLLPIALIIAGQPLQLGKLGSAQYREN